MAQARNVIVDVGDRDIQCSWDNSELATGFSDFPADHGILLDKHLMFPENLCLWRMKNPPPGATQFRLESNLPSVRYTGDAKRTIPSKGNGMRWRSSCLPPAEPSSIA